jgi:DNA-directed RNA polymerase subunit M/transcription elongation factor TFIIS
MQDENEKAVRTPFFDAFEKWTEKRGVWPRLTHDEIFAAGWQAALQSQVSNTDGWLEWPGGDCPVAPETLVEVEYRSATPNFPATRSWPNNAREFYWEHLNGPNDIVRYRVVSAAPKAPQQVSNTPQDGAPDQSVYNTIASRYFASPPQQEQSGEAVQVCPECDIAGCRHIRERATPTATASQESLGTTQEAVKFPGKIERHCPRCRTHAFHWLTRNGEPSALKNTKLHTATCANCGHQWPCRVMGKDL